MINILVEGIYNWSFVFWMHIRIMFIGSPDLDIGGHDPLEGGVRVWIGKRVVQFWDYNGSIIYKLDYDYNTNSIILINGTDVRAWCETSSPSDEYKIVQAAFKEYTRSSVEKVLIGE